MPNCLRLLTLIAIAFFSVAAPPGTRTEAQDESLSTQEAEILELKREVTELRVRLEENQNSDEKVIGIVSQAVGIVLTISILLVGYNVVQSRWLEAENRKAAVREIQSELDSVITRRLNEEFSDYQSRNETLIRSVEKQLNDSAAENKRWKDQQEAETIRRLELTNSVGRAEISDAENRLDSRFASLEQNLRRMQLEQQTEALTVALKNNFFVSTFQATALIELALEAEASHPEFFLPDFHVTNSLDLLRQTIGKAFSLDDSDINRIRIILDSLPPKYAASRDSILPLLVPRPFGSVFPPAPSVAGETDWYEAMQRTFGNRADSV